MRIKKLPSAIWGVKSLAGEVTRRIVSTAEHAGGAKHFVLTAGSVRRPWPCKRDTFSAVADRSNRQTKSTIQASLISRPAPVSRPSADLHVLQN